MKIQFMWNGIKVDGKLYPAWYSDGHLTNHPEGTITIYAKNYESFPLIEGLIVHNDSDSMTDYFEKDRIRVIPENIYYVQVIGALNLLKLHNAKNALKRQQKYDARKLNFINNFVSQPFPGGAR